MAPGQQDYCCVVGSGACELVNPVGVFKIYRQIFCFELICGCPVQEAYFDTQLSISKSAARSGSAAAEDIVPCSACCCDFTSLYLKWPECCGIYSKSTMVCLEREYVACKPAFLGGAQNPKQNLLCLCAQGNCLLVPPKTCVKAETQEFCFDYRCALPCDEDVPCLCMPIMFCTCCVNGQCYCGCCQSLQTIRHLGRPPAPPAVSTQQPNPAAY